MGFWCPTERACCPPMAQQHHSHMLLGSVGAEVLSGTCGRTAQHSLAVSVWRMRCPSLLLFRWFMSAAGGNISWCACGARSACHTGGLNSVQVEKTLSKESLVKYLDGGFTIDAIVHQVRARRPLPLGQAKRVASDASLVQTCMRSGSQQQGSPAQTEAAVHSALHVLLLHASTAQFCPHVLKHQ